MIKERKRGFYEKYIKRLLDVICSLMALILFGWLYVLIAILVRIRLGSPVIFKQPRPGMIDPKTGKETIFEMLKFRTMSYTTDERGKMLPDEDRIESFGLALRRTSLDELIEVFNIIKGEMSIVGPRPQLVKDMVFMSDEQRRRHTAKPGLTGLAQVMGRNALSWEDKIGWDLKYIENISFINDLKIVLMTLKRIFCRMESPEELDTTDDYGDALLKAGKVKQEEYDSLQQLAENLIMEYRREKGEL